MADYLVFTLAASLGAMGDVAGHERRGSWTWPGRSAILGLLGAALGIRREDAQGQAGLNGLQMAVAVFSEGVPLRDYHTVQTIPTPAAKRPDSRPDAFRKAGLSVNTTITLRDYRAGGVYAVAVWGEGLERLAAALAKPVFTLYLGRKSCPLSMPPRQGWWFATRCRMPLPGRPARVPRHAYRLAAANDRLRHRPWGRT
jgi:CRISPR system Cascade subunit CasD